MHDLKSYLKDLLMFMLQKDGNGFAIKPSNISE